MPIVSLRKPRMTLCAAAKIGDLRLHDPRRSFASVGAGALLGHTQPATTARYAYLAGAPLHDAVDVIGASIATAMSNG